MPTHFPPPRRRVPALPAAWHGISHRRPNAKMKDGISCTHAVQVGMLLERGEMDTNGGTEVTHAGDMQASPSSLPYLPPCLELTFVLFHYQRGDIQRVLFQRKESSSREMEVCCPCLPCPCLSGWCFFLQPPPFQASLPVPCQRGGLMPSLPDTHEAQRGHSTTIFHLFRCLLPFRGDRRR